jgi:ribosome-binding protein aMBF1 (putative translation factor)
MLTASFVPVLIGQYPEPFGNHPSGSAERHDHAGIVPTVRVMPSLGTVVARNVRAERARQRMRQQDLADRMGWSIGMISDTESGQRRIGVDDLPALCRALGVPFMRLLVGADSEDLEALAWRVHPDAGITG